MTIKDHLLDTFYYELRRFFNDIPMTLNQQEDVLSLMEMAYVQGFADAEEEDDRTLN